MTGDTHGDFSRFSKDIFTEQEEMSRDDYVIICGDFGGIWTGGKDEDPDLDWLEELPYTTLFITGNHENYEALARYPVEEWHGAKVQFIRPHVIHLMRGQVFEIDGHTFFTMGGASSHDVTDGILDPDDPLFERKYRTLRRQCALFRINHISWWKEELPSEAEYEEARKNLDAHGWSVDYIVTHCVADTVQDILSRGLYQRDKLTAFLDEVYRNARYRRWYFGHYHENYRIGRKHILLYNMILPLEVGDDEEEETG